VIRRRFGELKDQNIEIELELGAVKFMNEFLRRSASSTR
jgi:hypothetical protein